MTNKIRAATAAIQRLLDATKLNDTQVSREMGMNPKYIKDIKQNKSDVRLSTFCAIARACGFKVVAIRDSYGETDTIDLTDIRPNNMQ